MQGKKIKPQPRKTSGVADEKRSVVRERGGQQQHPVGTVERRYREASNAGKHSEAQTAQELKHFAVVAESIEPPRRERNGRGEKTRGETRDNAAQAASPTSKRLVPAPRAER